MTNQRNRTRMTQIKLKIELPKNLPPPAQDPGRPKFTFQEQGSSPEGTGNWYDGTGDIYTRSAWGTWNNYDEAEANPYPRLPNPFISSTCPRGSRNLITLSGGQTQMQTGNNYPSDQN